MIKIYLKVCCLNMFIKYKVNVKTMYLSYSKSSIQNIKTLLLKNNNLYQPEVSQILTWMSLFWSATTSADPESNTVGM